MFSTTIITNLDDCRTECEISDSSSTVAIVYEGHDGWHVSPLRTVSAEERQGLDASVTAAKERLSHYVNPFGIGVPAGLTLGGLSLWLMQKDDGTAMGINLKAHGADATPRVMEVPADTEHRVRSLARDGRQIEAIRELRMITNCSLEQAKAWLNDNCR